MENNQDLTDLLALDLSVNIVNRRPYAKEVFKWQDMDLLPHSSADTLLCEIFEWNGRNWRTTENNLIGFLFSGDLLNTVKQQLMNTPKHPALIPDFEFTKDSMEEYGLSLPSLFNIGVNGNINNAKSFSVRVNGVTKSRVTNIDSPGIEILRSYSQFTQDQSKPYRKNIKFNYLSTSLFYAESVEIFLEKESGVGLDVSFQTTNVEVDAKIDTDTKKHFVLKYSGNQAPFAAKFTKGKDFNIM
ncbi:hypothetical protein EG346_12035 [Chryseobacterium carnipullorum]|uniref:Uncharacterized protein n=1 Tax=Chryseobacterium carnipullorum TaxID=1124835 RepID=A0A376DR70_CHRCU|nr:hypothetical protein [Chryseobacterium carnipullorum]AZA48859.1 hypothetical protein EG346_12035 [Chryseobacterium carnipullorum]AZA63765.1 hypothetical protein EG345_02945 [Chryseobacterium carnipullorum]STC93374.1 Uncharacterised protein [Chryseobacterium carnipullorum]